jgi:hypothetical protein
MKAHDGRVGNAPDDLAKTAGRAGYDTMKANE